MAPDPPAPAPDPAVPPLSFDTVLIANRGEIALRLTRALHALHLRAAAVYVSDDARSPHVRAADVSHSLGASSSLYTDIPSLLRACRAVGAAAVLPGYGFLSESAAAARAVEDAGLVWLGPTSASIELFGLKHGARRAAMAAGVPVVPGSDGIVSSVDALKAVADTLGFPLLLKASAGGGGMGQMVAYHAEDLATAFDTVTQQAVSLFGNGDILVERYVARARHVEVQVFGDGRGGVVAVGDRDCSLQRRRQKVIEEGPAPGLPYAVRTGLHNAAKTLCETVDYRSAGTVEFIVDGDDPTRWYFLEVNTRLQVEHGVTEMVSRVDLARAMILLGGLATPALVDRLVMAGLRAAAPAGVCIEARVYAENPVTGYTPGAGTVSQMVWPPPGDDASRAGVRVRVDDWAETGVVVSGRYDPMLGKVLVWGPTRAHAVRGLVTALRKVVVRGVPSNVELLLDALQCAPFVSGVHTTLLLDRRLRPRARAVQVLAPGLQTSVQDYPGRVGYWSIGVSPSGPMDMYAMCAANALVGNHPSKAALEITLAGPTLRFHADATVALCGASGALPARIDDVGHSTQWRPLPYWTPTRVRAGSVLQIGVAGRDGYGRQTAEEGGQASAGGGKTAYLAIRGGIDAPKFLGSAATFPTGSFGGVTGAFLAAGDMLPIGIDDDDSNGGDIPGTRWPEGTALLEAFIPRYPRPGHTWDVGALNGPHGSDDFLAEASLHELWTVPYEVQHATNRLGARLLGPVPQWTRADGGSAGLHPSNLHDYVYAPGALNLSGNTPIVLMLDGPSLGGFVCPMTVASAELWKVAQARPGDKIRFRPVDFDSSRAAMADMKLAWQAIRRYDKDALTRLAEQWTPWWVSTTTGEGAEKKMATMKTPGKAILAKTTDTEFDVAYRMSGDEHILVEYGAIELDLAYRIRVHQLMDALSGRAYIRELCPGVRSLLVRFDRDAIHVDALTAELTRLEASGELGLVCDVRLPSRVIELPLAFNDRWTVEAQARYLRSVRPDAPYMPSNVEFMRRINGLASVDEVRALMCAAEYMVLGLGDVYLGAPCAVPVDPRHRMVTSKYNPARTYTPEGAVGIGGAYMCIYGMDSPGGYQLAGRTLPIWDSYGTVPEEQRGSPKDIPWLLRFFDRVKFFLVSDDELESMREAYRNGAYKIKITHETFTYADHARFLDENKDSIAQFERNRMQAYNEERARWDAEGEGASDAAARHANTGDNTKNEDSTAGAARNGATAGDGDSSDDAHKQNQVAIRGGMSANVWSVSVTEGQRVEHGDQVVSLESMKVEMAIRAPIAGIVSSVSVQKGDSVHPDDVLVTLSVQEDDENSTSSGMTIAQLREHVDLGLTGYDREIAKCKTHANTAGVKAPQQNSSAANGVTIDRLQQGGLYGVPFITSHDAPQAVVSAVINEGAVLVGKTEDVEKAMGCGAGIFGIVLGKNDDAIQPQVQGGVNSGLVTMWVSNGLLPTLCHDDNGDDDIDEKWTVNTCVGLFGRCAEDVTAILRSAIGARKLTSKPELLLPLPDDGVEVTNVVDVCDSGTRAVAGVGGRSAIRIGACKYSTVTKGSCAAADFIARDLWGRWMESQVWSEMDVLAVVHDGDDGEVGVMFAQTVAVELGCCAMHGRLGDEDGTVVTLLGRALSEHKVVAIARETQLDLNGFALPKKSGAVRILQCVMKRGN